MSERCDKCGAKWDEHEFAVPAPYCPEYYEALKNQLTAMRERAEKAEADVKVARGQFEGACIIIDQLAQRIREFEENNGN